MSSRSLVNSSLIVLFVRILGASLQVVLVAVAVAYFPIELVGANAVLWSCAIVARVSGTLGLDLFVLRELPVLWTTDRDRFRRTCGIINRSLGAVLVGIYCLLASFLFLSLRGDSFLELAVVVPVVMFVSSFHRLWSVEIRARGSIIFSQVLDTIFAPTLAIAAMLVSAAISPDLLLVGQMIALSCAALVVRIFVQVPAQARGGFLSWGQWKGILPLGVGTLFSVVASRGPLLVVSYVSVSQAAIYDVGQRFHSAATLASTSASSVFLPRVNEHVVNRRSATLTRELISTSIIGAVPAGLIVAGLFAIGPYRFEDLLGVEYAGAWRTTVLLTSAGLVTALFGICHGFLAMVNRAKSFVAIAAVQAAAVIILGALLLPSASEMALILLLLEVCRGIVLCIMVTRFVRRIDE